MSKLLQSSSMRSERAIGGFGRGASLLSSLAVKAMLFVGLLIAGFSASAENLYVRKGATGSNTGADWNNAWSEMSQIKWGNGTGLLGPGDTLYIAGGNYTSGLNIQGSGDSANWIQIKRVRATDSAATGAAGWNSSYDSQVVINPNGTAISWNNASVGNYVIIDGRLDQGLKAVCGNVGGAPASVGLTTTGLHDITLTNIDMAGPGGTTAVTMAGNNAAFAAMYYSGGWQPFYNLKVTHSRLHGTVNIVRIFNVRDSIFENCQMYDCDAANSSEFHPNICEYGGDSRNMTWRYNTFWNWSAEGLMIHQQSSGGPHYIYGNVWYGTHSYGRCVTAHTTVAQVYFYNNTVYDCYWAFTAENGGSFSSSSEAKNNIFWNMQSSSGVGNIPITANNLDSTGSTSPFSNLGSKDFHLTSTSAARNSGVALGAAYNLDMDGNTRGSDGTWDKGAFEYGGTPANQAPTVNSLNQNAADVDPILSGLQILEGTVVQYSGTASDPEGATLTWQWIYTVNGGAETVYSSGSGTISPVSFTYSTGNAGKTYVWKLRVSDGNSTGEAQTTVTVVAPPTVPTGLTFDATAGTISGFSTSGGYISQSTETAVTAGGRAVYSFQITNAGNYVIQATVNAPDAGANSFFVNIDAEPQDPTGIWQIPVTSGFENRIVSWQGAGTWDNPQFVPKVFALSAGTHQVIFRGREANTQLSRISIVKLLEPPSNLRVAGP